MTSVPRRTQWQPRVRANGLFGPRLQPAGILRPSQPSLHPVIHVPSYMDHYSFTDPWGMDGWLSWRATASDVCADIRCFQWLVSARMGSKLIGELGDDKMWTVSSRTEETVVGIFQCRHCIFHYTNKTYIHLLLKPPLPLRWGVADPPPQKKHSAPPCNTMST